MELSQNFFSKLCPKGYKCYTIKNKVYIAICNVLFYNYYSIGYIVK